ncbi:hypothetical protein BG015_008759 [Linnemannia schmuckeri]|uniref:Peptidase A1 domain-containing protein n=1 Tax=Linnemannia schmuckeri TaxID=64567 RepID=A0A9P5RX09_9FUNG|nr:hypothetical protein BG015_008759 [Linnemannia schmuckeri]
MKLTLLLSLALATTTTFSNASPFDEGVIGAVPLILNPDYVHNTPAHIQKLNKRYPNIKIKAGGGLIPVGTGKVGLVNVNPDLEYYGAVKVGTPAQTLKLIFDTGSSDIWFPSTSCSTPACKAHTRFNPSKSSTYKKNNRPWKIAYGDGSFANGHLASEIVNIGGVQVRQTVGLAKNVSDKFKDSPEDGIFGLGFNTLSSVKGVNTFMDNAIETFAKNKTKGGVLKQPVVSVFLPSLRKNGGRNGHVLFGGIDHSRYTGQLHYVPVTQKGFWQVKLDAFKSPSHPTANTTSNAAHAGNKSGWIEHATPKQEAILDTGTTLIILSTTAAKQIHSSIPGATLDPKLGYLVPCSLRNSPSSSSIGFKLNRKYFKVPLADLAFEAVDGEKKKTCLSGVQGGQEGLWILGDVFIKNNYCVFDHSPSNPRVGLAPLKY